MFIDIVGSETRAEIGPHRWSEPPDAPDAAVRRELERFRGREMETTGDSFLATFDGPGRAIRCACAIRDSLRPLDIEARAGLHTGEIETRGGNVAGVAVHIAASVLALAGPGEVLVSAAVPPLVFGSGIDFEERGEHEIDGLPGRWKILAVDG